MSKIIAIGPSTFADEDTTPLRMLQEAGYEVRDNALKRRLTEEEIIAHLDGAVGLIAGLEPLNRTVLTAAAPQLKALARVGIGVANVDFDAAAELGVKVSSTPEGPIRAVGELTVAALLCLCRRLLAANEALHAGGWKKEIGLGLGGTKVLFLGYGRIGRHTASLLRPFGAEILVQDPYLDIATLEHGERVVGFEEGLAEAEVITLHASGEDCVLDAAAFGHMRDGVILLNSARGGLVDEDALVQALDSGKVGAVWFDAFWKEPYTGPLTRYPQALLTPHVATYTRQCRLEMESQAVRNLLRDLEEA
jgi:D-3-phosphoglycerate dehydrogenase